MRAPARAPHLAWIALLLAACTIPQGATTAASSPHAPRTATDAPAWAAPDIARATRVVDGRSGQALSFEAFLDRLSRADAVFLGETHVDETTHRVELATLQGLLARKPGRVVLAMEMFERDVQGALDEYLRGALDEPAFLARARPWSNYATAYRPLVEAARAARAPVVASNFPAPLRRLLAGADEADPAAALDALPPEQRAFAPALLLANTPAYWRRVDNAIRGHLGMLGPAPAADDPRLLDTQSLWDNAMGESVALALARHPGATVVHVNGGFHSEYWDGTARQLALRRPQARRATVAIVPVSSPSTADVGGAPQADFVVFAEERGRDLNEGTYGVHVGGELRYRLTLPHSARAQDPVPLLIWLDDDGLGGEDGLALWRARLGDECALAVLEAPYRESAEDGSTAGRWFFPDTFTEDVSRARQGIEGCWGYLLRHLPIDPARVVLAGEGTGATVVSAATMLSDLLSVRALAFGPRRFAKIKDFPLPLPEFYGDQPPPQKSLRLFLAPGDREWWSSELEAYRGIGLDAAEDSTPADPWSAEDVEENALRAALGLGARAASASTGARRHVVATTPRARLWGRLAAQSLRARGVPLAVLPAEPTDAGSQPIDLASELDLSPASFALEGAHALPRCPGPFGGTTVLVVPEGANEAQRAAWHALQANDPLAARSRFHRLRVVDETSRAGSQDLAALLAALLAENRKNVLIVPAQFCAEGDLLRRLRAAAAPWEDPMTLQWSPGLGGCLAPPTR